METRGRIYIKDFIPYIYVNQIMTRLNSKVPAGGTAVTTSVVLPPSTTCGQHWPRRSSIPDSTTEPDRDSHSSMYKIIPVSELQSCSLNYRLSQSGWYYPDMGREQCKVVLDNLPAGHFLLRGSSTPSYKYTLSLKSDAGGVLSIRIASVERGGLLVYHLDCSRKLKEKPCDFYCVIELIESLVNTKALDCYQFTDNRGQALPLRLSKPTVPQAHCLKHLARLSINRAIRRRQLSMSMSMSNTQMAAGAVASVQQLPLPTNLKDYLIAYPHLL